MTIAISSILLVVSAPAAAIAPTTFTNTGSIAINQTTSPPTPAMASPYPSEIAVSGLTGTISNLTVTLSGMSGASVQDFSVLLVGPGGQSLVLFASVGSPFPITATSGLNVTLDDSASTQYQTANTSLPSTGSVSLAPSDLAVDFPGYDVGLFPSPAPQTSLGTAEPTGSATLAAVFDGTNPNGTWSLYVDDDSNDGGGSLAGGWSLDITTGAQTIAYTSTAPADATVGGNTYTPTATASSGLPVTLTIDSSSAGVCSMDDSGAVSFTSVGTCTIDANQAGDGSYAAAPQVQQAITVGKGSQAITFTSTAPTDATVGGPTYTPTATASPSDLPVTFSIDSSSDAGACAISSGVVSFTGVGNCVIDANQAGDGNYTGAPQVQLTIPVGQGSQSIDFTSTAPTDAIVNGPSYSPRATGGASGNPVVFTIDPTSTPGACSISSGVVSFTGAGNCVIDANQAGDADYLPAAQVQQTVSVGLDPQTITFTSTTPTNATVDGTTYTPTATATPSHLAVTFSIDSASTAGACSISSGIVTFTGAGTCVIDANQAGDGVVYAPAPQIQQQITVGRGSQTISFASNVPENPTIDGPGYTPAGTGGASGNPVVFSIDPSSTTGACTINSGVVSFTGAGTCVIDANQAGDANYTPAPQAQEPITIEPLDSSTTVAESGTTVTATVTGGGPTPNGSVVFSVNGNVVGTVQLSQGIATLGYSFAPGQTYTVTAEYAGDSAHAPSSDTLIYTAPASTGTTPPAGGTSTPPPTGTKTTPSTPTTPTTPPPAPKRKLAPLKITLKLSSSRPEQHGWWTAPVTVSFTCTRAGKRVAKCPRPLRLDKSGNHVVNGHKINIDLGKPSLRIVGLNAGATYLVSAPAPGCRAQDAISGIRSCSVSEKVTGRATGEQTLRFTAKAVSNAGTVTSRSVTVSEQQLGLIGLVSSVTGIYAINTGRTYTLEVAARTKPLYVEGAVAPQRPVGAHNWFVLNGHRGGTPLWQLSVLLPSGLPQNAYWNVGVQIGNTLRIIAIRD